MQTELRKLAAALRARAKKEQADKMTKCAQVLRASTSLHLLARKIGG